MKTIALLSLATSLAVVSAMPPLGGYGGYMPSIGYGSGYVPAGGISSPNPSSGYGGFMSPGIPSLLPSPVKTVAKVKTAIASVGKVLPSLKSATNTTSAVTSAIKKYFTATKTPASTFQPTPEY
ncbi:uncharacterized protein LOC122253216 [Penaeus japonicus]|uniref:uncharacterized protein LOC122253216 n=1 Tax=Penaeus japonicus TaxID=27405 RepID=UPI001C70B319|nr:uncharacterized protein LOC122253216 [Penaeus japonicus]